jgi:hypothetical protein
MEKTSAGIAAPVRTVCAAMPFQFGVITSHVVEGIAAAWALTEEAFKLLEAGHTGEASEAGMRAVEWWQSVAGMITAAREKEPAEFLS